MRVHTDIAWLDKEFEASAILRGAQRNAEHLAYVLAERGNTIMAGKAEGIAFAIEGALRCISEAQGLRSEEICSTMAESIGSTFDAIFRRMDRDAEARRAVASPETSHADQ